MAEPAISWLSAIGALVSAAFAWLSWKQANRAHDQATKAHKDLIAIEALKLNREQEWRLEDRSERAAEREAEARENRIKEITDRWATFETIGGGLAQFLRAGALTLHSDEELRDAAKRLASLGYEHPFGGYIDLFDRIDALEALKEWDNTYSKKPGTDLATFLNAVRTRYNLPPATQRVRR